MTKLLKKSLALVLTLALCLSAMACCFIVSAEGEEPTRTLTIELDETTANPVAGDTVILNVVGSWTDVAGAEFTVTGLEAYDLTLTPTNTEDDVLYEHADGTVKFVDGNNEPLDDGVLFSISFVAATAGDYTAAIADVVFCDVDENDVAVTTTGITVTVNEVVTHEHVYTATVTTQPTKDAEGVMTYTCECGDSYTEAIAIPTEATGITFKGDIYVSAVVGDAITLSTKQMRTAYGDDATYFIVIDYQNYGDGYVIENKSVTLTDADKVAAESTANKVIFKFTGIALYEMTLDFTATVYYKNADGVVVGYNSITTNLVDMALAYAPTASATLLTALADMCNYGAAAQEYFAAQNPGTDICDAASPTELFAAYMDNASSTEGMPAAGDYNNDKSSTKIVSSTGFVSAGQTLKIAASNQIQYTVRYDNYDFNDVVIKVYYEDSLAGLQEVTLTAEDLIANGTTGAGMPKYLYYFSDLALYDCDKTVTMDMYYNGTKELTSVYSFGNFVNTYLNDAALGTVLTNMELFSNSVGIQLGLAARW